MKTTCGSGMMLLIMAAVISGMCTAADGAVTTIQTAETERDKIGTTGGAGNTNGSQTLLNQVFTSQCSFIAERQGFEPWVPCGTLVFETSTIGHSVTSPVEDAGKTMPNKIFPTTPITLYVDRDNFATRTAPHWPARFPQRLPSCRMCLATLFCEIRELCTDCQS